MAETLDLNPRFLIKTDFYVLIRSWSISAMITLVVVLPRVLQVKHIVPGNGGRARGPRGERGGRCGRVGRARVCRERWRARAGLRAGLRARPGLGTILE